MIYIVSADDQTETKKTFELNFSKVEKTNMTIKARTLEEAVKLGRAQIGDDWELYTGYAVKND